MNKDVIITLDDNKKYVIISDLNYEKSRYLYLTDIDDFANTIIGKLENEEIEVVEDKELFGKLFIEFSKILEN